MPIKGFFFLERQEEWYRSGLTVVSFLIIR